MNGGKKFMQSKSAFMRRIFAALIDYGIWYTIAIVFFLWQVPIEFFYLPSISHIPKTPLFWILCLLLFLICVFRNLLFGNASLGKVLLGLRIYDKKTGKKAGIGKLILRSVFFMIPQIDLIVLLLTKQSIGDMVAETVVDDKRKSVG